MNKLKLNGTEITVRTAHCFFTRLVGLLGVKALPNNACLWIKPCISIHTFFMRFDIDVVFIDREGYVLKMYKNVAPWKVKSCKNALSVVEFESGKIDQLIIKVGQKMEFVAC